MCGLLGWISQKKIDPNRFKQALNTLKERGPDGEGSWYGRRGEIALGHRRLAVVSDNGVQPLKSENENIIAIVNGEFYNYQACRKELRKKGHRFSTDSDSEILVHLYEEYGEDCVKYLDGEFAFVLWDREADILFAGRDRFGVKPLVYAEHLGDFFIASKAIAIMNLTEHRRWDRDTLMASIHHQYAPQNSTVFDGIRSLPPGHILHVRKGRLTIKHYWDLYNVEEGPALTLKVALQNAVKKRLQGDGPVTCSLSGGIDSSAIAALIANMQTNTEAFTVDFSESGSVNIERQEAVRVANYLGIELNIVDVNPSDVFENLGTSVFHSEGLAINAHLSAKYLLSKRMHEKNFKVVLTGEGADELLYGYPHLRQDIFGSDASAIQDFDKVSSGVMVADDCADEFPDIIAALGFVPSFFRAKLSLGHRASSQTTNEMQNKILSLRPSSFLKGFDMDAVPKESKAKAAAYLWSKLALEKYILTTLGDGTEMANSIEGRTPFLDDDVVRSANAFMPKSCFKDGLEKIQLRQAMKGLLPDETLARHKQPFIGPPVSFSKSAEGMVHAYLEKLEHSAIWNAKVLRETWKNKSKASYLEQQKWDPVFMLAFSTFEVEKQFGLEAL